MALVDLVGLVGSVEYFTMAAAGELGGPQGGVEMLLRREREPRLENEAAAVGAREIVYMQLCKPTTGQKP